MVTCHDQSYISEEMSLMLSINVRFGRKLNVLRGPQFILQNSFVAAAKWENSPIWMLDPCGRHFKQDNQQIRPEVYCTVASEHIYYQAYEGWWARSKIRRPCRCLFKQHLSSSHIVTPWPWNVEEVMQFAAHLCLYHSSNAKRIIFIPIYQLMDGMIW